MINMLSFIYDMCCISMSPVYARHCLPFANVDCSLRTMDFRQGETESTLTTLQSGYYNTVSRFEARAL